MLSLDVLLTRWDECDSIGGYWYMSPYHEGFL